MPLNTQVIRGTKSRRLHWSEFKIAACIIAIMFENPDDWQDAKPNEGLDYPSEPQPINRSDAFTLVNYNVIGAVCPNNEYTFKNEHNFVNTGEEEEFNLKPGDTVKMWRSHRG